jgi:4-alpha-glucanotransferase
MELSPDQPLAGVLAPLFALRGEADLGIGDVGALREFVGWAADTGFGVVQLLPVNAIGNDNSPYNAISSVALEPTTIDISAVPELDAAEISFLTEQTDLEALRQGPVAYPQVKAVKRKLIERAYDLFLTRSWRRNNARARAFRRFVKANASWLEPYALFRALMEENGGSECWDTWEKSQRTSRTAWHWLARRTTAHRRTLERSMRFVMFEQWIAWTQWEELKSDAEKLGVALMGDVPFGVSYYSADVWNSPELFNLGWSGGAPPEPLFTDDAFTHKWGQNWGVPLYRWDALRKENFAWWRHRVRMVRRIFHLFRIDHVLGFYRIYGFPWRPERNGEFLPLSPLEAEQNTGGLLPRFWEWDDATPAHCAENRAHGEERLRHLLEETGAYRLIGEDLGTVPEYVRPSLRSLDIPGFKIPFWEHDASGTLTPGAAYERLSVATYATHDHEPMRALWEHWMSVIEAALHRPHDLASERDRAWWDVRRLAAWAGFSVPCITAFEDVHEKLLEGLLRANSWLAITMITDVFGTSQRFNVPGAVSESNWSQRLALPISAWERDTASTAATDRMRRVIRATQRHGPVRHRAGNISRAPATISSPRGHVARFPAS